MDFYVVLCVCLAILLIFSVGESFFKQANVKKYNVIIFLFVSILFSYLPQLKVLGFKINFNFILYLFAFVILIFKTKKIKDFIKIFVTFCITLTLCVCYNSLNLLQFEFSYFQPYLILASVIGIICSVISDKYNTIYSGVFGAVFVSELIRSKNLMFDIQNNFSLGDMQFSTIILVSMVSFLISVFFVKVVKKLKHKFSNARQEKQQNV